MQLPESFKGTDSSGETLLQPTGNSRLQKYVILIQSYVYNEMITLFPIKVPVKKYSNLDWIRQDRTDLFLLAAFVLAALIAIERILTLYQNMPLHLGGANNTNTQG